MCLLLFYIDFIKQQGLKDFLLRRKVLGYDCIEHWFFNYVLISLNVKVSMLSFAAMADVTRVSRGLDQFF